ncbi:HNH endonuclease [Metabacillus halosaccharovorans]|uniref:HNH endonuclease n=1 Tax=Metabacillus halosaccharovorans TaxID=930124 RepID=UPI003D33BD96
MRCYFKLNYVNISNLEVHHIKPRSKYPELEMESTNLITLCKKCNLELGTREALDFEYEILNPIDRSYSL